MPFWTEIDAVVAQLVGAEEKIDGTRARFPVRLFGQFMPNVPLLIHTNGGWKVALDLNVRGNARIAGKQSSSFQIGFAGNGLRVGLSTRLPLAVNDMRDKCKLWADGMQRLSQEIRAGKYADAEAAANACDELLDPVFYSPDSRP